MCDTRCLSYRSTVCNGVDDCVVGGMAQDEGPLCTGQLEFNYSNYMPKLSWAFLCDILQDVTEALPTVAILQFFNVLPLLQFVMEYPTAPIIWMSLYVPPVSLKGLEQFLAVFIYYVL